MIFQPDAEALSKRKTETLKYFDYHAIIVSLPLCWCASEESIFSETGNIQFLPFNENVYYGHIGFQFDAVMVAWVEDWWMMGADAWHRFSRDLPSDQTWMIA